ncbi:MAG: CsgG/HfaB family protein [Spirochaetota bacterium]
MFKLRIHIFYAIILITLLKTPALSVTLAVLELNPNGVSNIISYAVTDIVRSEFVNIGNFTVVERTRIKAILEEHGLQMTGCTDQSCAVEIGKMLNAEKLIVGEVNSVEQTIVITIRYIDIKSSVSMFSSTGKAANNDEVIKTAELTAKDLIRKIVEGDKEIIMPVLPLVYYSVSFIPGCGQLYAGEEKKGWIFLSSFIATGALTICSIINYKKKREEYRDLGELQAGSDEYDRKYRSAKRAGYFAMGATVLCSLVYIANWIDVLFITKPVFRNIKDATKNTGSVEAGIRIYNINYPRQELVMGMGVSLKF